MNHKTFTNKLVQWTAAAGMRILTLLLVILPLVSAASPARAEGDIEWIQRIATYHNQPTYVSPLIPASGPDGSVYVLGTTDGILPGQTQIGREDLFIQQYTPDGADGWAVQFGTISRDTGQGIAVNSTGIYVSGVTGGAFDGFASAGGGDAFIVKYNLDGTFAWVQQFGISGSEYNNKIAVTDEAVYVAGYGYKSPDGVYSGDTDYFIHKYSLAGELLWSTSYGSTYNDAIHYVATDGTDIYVYGAAFSTYGTIGNFVKKINPSGVEQWNRQVVLPNYTSVTGFTAFGSRVYLSGLTNGALPGEVRTGSYDAFVKTFSSVDGSDGWLDQFGGTGANRATSLVVDASGVYVGGYTDGSFPNYISAGAEDIFVRQYGLEGGEGWTLQFGTPDQDQMLGMTSDASGIYLAGWTKGALDGQTSSGDIDSFIKKVSPAAAPLWTKQFGMTATIPDHDFASAVDADGNVYMAGVSAENYFWIVGETDAFLAKYSPAGEQIWMKQLNSQHPDLLDKNDGALAVAVDPAGNIYLVGYVDGALNGQTNAGYVDAFLIKLNKDGTELWARQFGTDQSDIASLVAVDGSGVYVAGTTDGSLGGPSLGQTDIFVRKFSPNGEVVWSDQFGSSRTEAIEGMAVNSSGLYLGGTTPGALDGFVSAGYDDLFLRKYNLDGTTSWTQQFGTDNTDTIYDIGVDGTGIYVTGVTGGDLAGMGNYGREDAFLLKYSLDGTGRLWANQFGTQGMDYGTGLAVKPTGVYVVGYTTFLSTTYDTEAFLRKYSPDGAEAWSRSFDQATELEHAKEVVVDSTGIYVVGSTTLFDTFDSQDATLVKLTIDNPVVGAISGPMAPVAVNTDVNTSASFTDANTADTHTAVWDWGDGTTSDGMVSESGGSGTVDGTHAYATPGVYEIKVTVTDQTGLSGSLVYQYAVVYDPSVGFVTGAGWIQSPAGAYPADPSLAGKATFAFVSRYEKGAALPSGHTGFHFTTANLRFQGTAYEWLLVAGARAQYKGSGEINGVGGYGFLLTAVDGDLNGGGGADKFRIKIWDKASGLIVYDNQVGADDSADPTTVIGAGSIKIQK